MVLSFKRRFVIMNISDVVEKTKEIVNDNKDICDSYDKTKNEYGINVDTYFTNLLKEKNLWKYTK